MRCLYVVIIVIIVISILCYCGNKSNYSNKNKIENNIFQTHKDKSIIKMGIDESYKKLRKQNPEFNYYFFSDEDMDDYMNNIPDKELSEAYKRVKHRVAKSDIWRIAILYEKGGVYVDMDSVPTIPLSKLIKPDDEFIKGVEWTVPDGPDPQHIIFSRSGHPVLERTIHHIKQAVLYNNPSNHIGPYREGIHWRKLESYTGTPCMWRALEDILGHYSLRPGNYKYGIRLIPGYNHGWTFHHQKGYKNLLRRNGIKHWMEDGREKNEIIY